MKVIVVPEGTSRNTSVLGIKGLNLGDLLGVAADVVIPFGDLSGAFKSHKDDGATASEAAMLALAQSMQASTEALRIRLNAGGNDARSYIEALADEFMGEGLTSADAANLAFAEADRVSKSPANTWLLIGGALLLVMLFGGKRRGLI